MKKKPSISWGKTFTTVALCTMIITACSGNNTPEGLAASGDKHRKNKEFDDAIFDYTKAIELDPASPALYRGRAQVWYDRGEWQKAHEDVEQAIKMGGDDGTSLLLRALIYRKQNRNSQAISALESALAQPSFSRRVEAYELLGKSYDESSDKFRAARNYANAAQELRQQGDLDKALKFYDLALREEESRSKPDYDWLAQTADQAGYTDKAERFRERFRNSGAGSMTISR